MKISTVILCVVFLLTVSSFSLFWNAEDADKQRTIVCSFWPEKVFALNVVGDLPGYNVSTIIPPKGTPHGFQLTPKAMANIASADLILANGYVENFLENLRKKYPNKQIVLSTSRLKLMENRFGISENEENEEEHDDHGHGHLNAHTWLSITNAISEISVIRDALVSIAPEHKETLIRNANNYIVKLHKLAIEFVSESAAFKKRNIVTFHNAFDYLATEIGINVIDVVMKVEGSAPSPKEAMALLDKIKSMDAEIFAEPQFPEKVANTLARASGKTIRILDPGVTTEPTPDAYEKIMRKNLEALSHALK